MCWLGATQCALSLNWHILFLFFRPVAFITPLNRWARARLRAFIIYFKSQESRGCRRPRVRPSPATWFSRINSKRCSPRRALSPSKPRTTRCCPDQTTPASATSPRRTCRQRLARLLRLTLQRWPRWSNRLPPQPLPSVSTHLSRNASAFVSLPDQLRLAKRSTCRRELTSTVTDIAAGGAPSLQGEVDRVSLAPHLNPILHFKTW